MPNATLPLVKQHVFAFARSATRLWTPDVAWDRRPFSRSTDYGGALITVSAWIEDVTHDHRSFHRRKEDVVHKPLYWASRLLTIVRRLGMRGAAAYLCKERALRALALVVSTRRLPMTYRLYSPMSSNPLVCRFGTSDRQVFAQIFIFRTYEALDPERSPRFIIDGGANVGYSSIYLLTRFPFAHVLAVEPDERNFELLLQNLASYGRRATALRAAIWSRCTGLILSRGTFGDGREWATEVLECDPASAADVDGFDVETLMTRSGVDRIDILKLDVEGSEIEIFREPGTWLHKVETIAIELHDEECNKTFFRALSSMPFDFVQQGELTFARRA